MITIDADKKTVTRTSDNQTWTFAETGLPNFFRQSCKKYGAEAVAEVLTEGNYYPPMIDRAEREEIEERLSEKYVAKTYLSRPETRPALEGFGYSAGEAEANK